MQIRYRTSFSITRGIILIAWTFSLIGYFFQFPFGKLSNLIVPCLTVYLIVGFCYRKTLNINAIWAKVYGFYFVYLVFMAILSALQRVEMSIIIRFLLLLCILPLFTILRLDKFKHEYNIFILLAVVKCLLLLYYAIQLIRTGDFLQLRQWAEANHYGDIYINPYTHLPKVQVHGNGILPMALILNAAYGKRGKINIINLILLLGILAAGNSAFLLGIAAYYIYRLYKNVSQRRKTAWVKLCSLIILFVGGIIFIVYSIYILSIKADYSDAIRIEQAKMLLDNYIVVGNGLGHQIFYKGTMRTYSGSIYFELQTLYIYNQIGLIGILLFYYLTIKPIKLLGTKKLILFLIYLLYTFWNPYCFDSTEMIVISLLVNFPGYEERKNFPQMNWRLSKYGQDYIADNAI